MILESTFWRKGQMAMISNCFTKYCYSSTDRYPT
uniref:Uncharacterized protein n=1 Tax=Arundo donax TaxID=35708 RepID=A0A0A9H5L6_ARUDO